MCSSGGTTNMICNVCNNKGFTSTVDEYGNESLSICKCKQEENIYKSLERAGLGKYSKTRNFKDFETTESWQKDIKLKCTNYAKNPKGWLTLLGQSRSGKTHLGIATAKNIVALNSKRNFITKYVIWTDLMYEMDYGKIPIDRYNELVSADLLYIDDFLKQNDGYVKTADGVSRRVDGTERVNAGEDRLAFAIINSRYNNEKPTIITSEILLADLEKYHFALSGRIIEMSGDNLIQIANDKNRRYVK